MLIGNAVLDTGVESVFSNAPVIKKSSVTQFQDDFSINNWSHSMTAISGNFLNLAAVLVFTSYLFLWIVSAVLLYRYSRRLGKSTVYWMVIFLPPVFFLIGQFHTLLGIPNADFTYFEQDAILFSILGILATIAGGLLFAVSFLALARSMRQIRQNFVADYLDIAGYGIAMLLLPILPISCLFHIHHLEALHARL
jgi:MFS family permease